MMRASRNLCAAPIEISGSGILFEKNLFSHAVQQLDKRAPGMDKNLLIQMLRLKPEIRMTFLHDAFVIDEKTNSLQAYERQRTRWFANQYFNAIFYSFALIKLSIEAKRWGIFDYTLSLWRPPRAFQFLALLLGMFLEGIWFWFYQLSIPFYTLGFALSSLALFTALQSSSLKIGSKDFLTFMKIGIKHAFLAIKSLSPKLYGTFIQTRG
jgi:hypothetical protein